MRDDNLECLQKVFMTHRAKNKKHTSSFTDNRNESPNATYSRKTEQGDINTPRGCSKRQETGVHICNVTAQDAAPIIE